MKVYFGDQTLKFIFLGFIIALSLSVMNFTWGTGYLLGISTMLVNIMMIERHVDNLLFNQRNSTFGNIIFFTLANALLTLPLLLSVLYPDKVNIFAATAGLLFYKYIFYIKEIFFKKEIIK